MIHNIGFVAERGDVTLANPCLILQMIAIWGRNYVWYLPSWCYCNNTRQKEHGETNVNSQGGNFECHLIIIFMIVLMSGLELLWYLPDTYYSISSCLQHAQMCMYEVKWSLVERIFHWFSCYMTWLLNSVHTGNKVEHVFNNLQLILHGCYVSRMIITTTNTKLTFPWVFMAMSPINLQIESYLL